MESTENIKVLEVSNKALLHEFVMLPYSLYRTDPLWVPPLISDEFALLSPQSNPAFQFCDVKMWIAKQNDKTVGRIATIINRLWQEKNNMRYGRLSRFECINNRHVANALFATAEAYLRNTGIVAAHGPLGFSNFDHQGLLVEGFEHLPSVASEYSKPYYPDFFISNGYTKQTDWLEFRLNIPTTLPPKVDEVVHYVEQRYGINCKTISSQKELKAYLPRMFELFNSAFGHLFGTFTFNNDLKQFYIQKYIGILQPQYIKVAERADGELIGFIIALPSLSEAMQKAKGKLLPLGWAYILKALHHPKVIDLLLTAVSPTYQRLGIASLLMSELWRTAIDNGVQYAETTGMLENNKVAVQMWKMLDHIQHKRKRCYIKEF